MTKSVRSISPRWRIFLFSFDKKIVCYIRAECSFFDAFFDAHFWIVCEFIINADTSSVNCWNTFFLSNRQVLHYNKPTGYANCNSFCKYYYIFQFVERNIFYFLFSCEFVCWNCASNWNMIFKWIIQKW